MCSGRLCFSVFAAIVLMMFLPMALVPQKNRTRRFAFGHLGKTRVVDLSYAISDKLVPWPGDKKVV